MVVTSSGSENQFSTPLHRPHAAPRRDHRGRTHQDPRHTPIPGAPIKTLRGVNGTKAFELLREKRVSMRFLARDRSNSRDERRCAVYPNDDCLHPLGSLSESAASRPRNIVTLGPDGNVWFAKVVPTGSVDCRRATTPPPNSRCLIAIVCRSASLPARMAIRASPNRRATVVDGLRLAERTKFRLPTATAGPNGIACGPDGDIRFAEADVDQVGRIRRRAKSPNIRRASPQWDSVIRPPLGGRAWLARAVGASATRIVIGNTLSSLAGTFASRDWWRV